jgi:hypothetical protein
MVRVILSEAVVNSCMTITAVPVKFILSVKRRVANPVFIISYVLTFGDSSVMVLSRVTARG